MFEYKLVSYAKPADFEQAANQLAKTEGWGLRSLFFIGKKWVAVLERELLMLYWRPGVETDLAGYKVYVSRTPQDGIERTWDFIGMFRAKPLEPASYPVPLALYNAPGREYVFSVSAFDIAGNESKQKIVATVQR